MSPSRALGVYLRLIVGNKDKHIYEGYMMYMIGVWGETVINVSVLAIRQTCGMGFNVDDSYILIDFRLLQRRYVISLCKQRAFCGVIM